MTNLEICMSLSKKLGEQDIAGIKSFLADDVVIDHPAVPEALLTSSRQFAEVLSSFYKWATEGSIKILRTQANDNRVWMERIDSWKIEEKWVDVPVVAIFDLENDVVVHWTEYLDFGYMNQFKTRPGDELHNKI